MTHLAVNDVALNSDLETNVKTQVSMLKNLLVLLDLERDALKQRNYDTLLEVSGAKQQQISQIETCHRNQPQQSEESYTDALRALISQRLELSHRCSRLNLANGTQINKQTFVAQRSLDVIQGVDSSSYSMYSKKGTNVRAIESRLATVA